MDTSTCRCRNDASDQPVCNRCVVVGFVARWEEVSGDSGSFFGWVVSGMGREDAASVTTPNRRQHEKSSQWVFNRVLEEGGCDFRLKKDRIYVQLHL